MLIIIAVFQVIHIAFPLARFPHAYCSEHILMSSIKPALSVPEERSGSQLLKQQAAKTAGLPSTREAFCCSCEALGHGGMKQVGGNSGTTYKETTGFKHPSPRGLEKSQGAEMAER